MPRRCGLEGGVMATRKNGNDHLIHPADTISHCRDALFGAWVPQPPATSLSSSGLPSWPVPGFHASAGTLAGTHPDGLEWPALTGLV
jgi:hypothetical protein